jgi:hypothetical protein
MRAAFAALPARPVWPLRFDAVVLDVFLVRLVFPVPVAFVVPVAAVPLGFADEPAVVCPANGVIANRMANAQASHRVGSLARDAQFAAEVRKFAVEAWEFATLISPL